MQPKLLLRIAAVAAGIIDLGHTAGAMLNPVSHGAEEDVVKAAFAAYRFEIMGRMRSHMDFYVGQGWYVSATMTFMLVLCWVLSSAVAESPKLVRTLSLTVAIFFAVSIALCVKYFFIAPLSMSVVAAIASGAAYVGLGKQA